MTRTFARAVGAAGGAAAFCTGRFAGTNRASSAAAGRTPPRRPHRLRKQAGPPPDETLREMRMDVHVDLLGAWETGIETLSPDRGPRKEDKTDCLLGYLSARAQRSFAEEERGFRPRSSGVGLTTCPRRARRGRTRGLLECLFYAPVLAGVEREDRGAAAGGEAVGQVAQEGVERRQLVVHEDADRLKGPLEGGFLCFGASREVRPSKADSTREPRPKFGEEEEGDFLEGACRRRPGAHLPFRHSAAAIPDPLLARLHTF